MTTLVFEKDQFTVWEVEYPQDSEHILYAIDAYNEQIFMADSYSHSLVIVYYLLVTLNGNASKFYVSQASSLAGSVEAVLGEKKTVEIFSRLLKVTK